MAEASFRRHSRSEKSVCSSPLEEEEIDVVIALGQEVSQHAGRVSAADLIGRQTEVDALHEVPELSHCVLTEAPAESNHPITRQITSSLLNIINNGTMSLAYRVGPISDSRENEEHPEVNAEDQDDLKDDLSHHGLPQVQRTIHHHSAELDQHHHQERLRNLVF